MNTKVKLADVLAAWLLDDEHLLPCTHDQWERHANAALDILRKHGRTLASLATLGGDGLSDGFESIEMRLRERTHTQRDPDDYLPPDAIQYSVGVHCNGQQYYHSRLDIEAADAIHTLGIALASQIEITNRERALAESCARRLATPHPAPAEVGAVARYCWTPRGWETAAEGVMVRYADVASLYTAQPVRVDEALGAWLRNELARIGPIKTVSGKDVYTLALPAVDRDAGVDAALTAALTGANKP